MAALNSPLLKNAINGGLVLGLIQIVLGVILYIFNIMPIGISKGLILLAISLLIYVVILIYSSKSYRNNVLGGYISFGQAFVFALLVVIVASVLSAIYNYVFNALIDPDYTAKVISATKDWTESFMESKGVPETTIEDAMKKIDEKGVVTPLNSAWKALMGGTIMGAIIALIIAAVVKKSKEIPSKTV